jgi:uncharacterized protein involved in outer membrane biogenesis
MERRTRISLLLTGLLGIGILFFIVLYVSIPALINSEVAKKKVYAYFFTKTGGSLSFQESDIRLFPHPHVYFRQVRISIPNKVDGLIQSLSAYPAVWPLLRGNVQFSKLSFESPRFTVALSEDTEKTSLEQIEEKIRSFARDLTSTAPAMFVTIQKGKVDLTKKNRVAFSFDVIQSRLIASGKSLNISLTCASNFSDTLSFNSSLNAEDLTGRGTVLMRHFRPRAIFSQLFPGAEDHIGDAVADVSLNFQIVGLRQIQANLDSSLPDLTISREGRNITMKDVTIRGDIEIGQEKVSILLSEVKGSDPDLHVSGEYSLDRASGSTKMSMEGRSIDVHSIRRSALSLGGDITVMRNIFDIVQGGTIPVLHFSSSGKSFSDLGTLEHMRISGRLQRGDIYISEKDLRFHDVTGDAIIAGGILEGENIEASLGNHRCSRGKLTMGLKGTDAPFHLNMWVKADVGNIPSLLKQKNLLSSKAVLRETGRLSGTRGSALGRLILGDRLDSIHVAFEVTEMNLAIHYEPLPFPLVITGGKVFFNEEIVEISGVHGSIGNSSFSGLTAKINLDTTAFIEIADGKLMLNTDDIYPWITSFRQIKPVLKDVPSMSGIIAVSSLTMKGSLYQPKDWRFTVNGEARKLAIDATFLPGRAEETTGMFKITEDKLDLKDVRMRMIDSVLKLSGTFRPFPANISSIALSLQGEIGPRVNSWISSFIMIPQELAVRAPFFLSDMNLSWEKNRSTTFDGRLLFGRVIQVALKLTKTPDELSVHEISVKDSDTDVTANVTLNKKAVDIVFGGIVTSSTLSAILAQHMVRDASLRGDFRAHILLKDPRQSVAEGVIEGRNFPIPWQYKVPLVMHDIALNAQNKHIAVNTAHFSLGKENFMLKGSIDTTPAWFSVDMDLSADGIEWETLENIVRGTNDKGEGNNAGLPQNIPVRGKVRMQSGFLRFRQFTLKPFHADISFDDERVHVLAKEAALCGISTTGDIHVTSHGAEVAIGLSARNLQLEPTLLCLSEKKVDMTGTFELYADLKAKGKIDTIEKSLHGTLNFSAKDGNIVRSQAIEKTLDLVNETENFKTKLPDLGSKIIDYRLLAMRGTIEEHRVVLEEGMLDASIFKILAQGEMNLREKTLDLNALVAPVGIGGGIVNEIPVLGPILGVNLVAVPVKIKGNLYDPQVTFLSPSAIGSAFLGIMERTIKLPITIIEPVLPQRK